MHLPTADLPPDCAPLRNDRIALIRWSGGRFLAVCDRTRSIRAVLGAIGAALPALSLAEKEAHYFSQLLEPAIAA